MSPYIHPRRLCREGVFQGLYALEISSEKKEKILDDIFKRYSFNSLNQAFISDLFFKTINNKEFLEKKIITHAENWEIQRIALLDKLILLMAICELYFMDDIPPKVTISEAIEIAKRYSTEESSRFVNGILDAVYKAMENKTQTNQL